MRQDIRFNSGRVRLDTTNCDKLQKQLGRHLFVRIGILGKHALREGDAASNADLGAVHEFGSALRNIPARSWLRMPLMVKLPGIFKSVGQRLINQMTLDNIKTLYQELGARAQKAIDQAFATSGFGFWKPNKLPYAKLRKGKIKMSTYKKASTKEKKEFSRPLIDTGEFRKAVDSDVGER